MTDKKITDLPVATGSSLADNDEFVVVDVSTDETKSITRSEFFSDVPAITSKGIIQQNAVEPIFRARSSGNTGNAYFSFGDSDDLYVGGIMYNHDSDFIAIYANNAERVQIDSSGTVDIFGGTVKLNGATMTGLQVTIADNAVAVLTFPNRVFGMLNLSEGSNTDSTPDAGGQFLGYVDFGSSPELAEAISGGSTSTNTSDVLTGTTGTDGQLTVGVGGVSGTLYIENRRGATRIINITLL